MELAHDLAFLPETLHVRDRLAGLPIKETAAAKGLPIVNPFSFISKLLLKSPKVMVKLCIATFLVCAAEGKNTNDLYQLWLQQDVGLSVVPANAMTVAYGVLMVASGAC